MSRLVTSVVRGDAGPDPLHVSRYDAAKRAIGQVKVEAAGMALSDDLRERVVGAVEGGMSRNGAAKRFGVSIGTGIPVATVSSRPCGDTRASVLIKDAAFERAVF